MLTPEFNDHFRDMPLIIQSIRGGSYFGIFIFSVFVSYVVPIPEAVFLLLLGFVAKTAGMDLFAVILISTSGIILGDNILYRLSFFGNKIVERFNRKMRENKLIKYEHLVSDNVAITVYFLKFVAGVRFFGPVVLGTLRASWRKFFIHNIVASVVHTSMLIFMGFYLSRHIVAVITGVELLKNGLLLASALIVGLLLAFFSKKNSNSKTA